jgi:hypothetical protein
VSGWQFVLNEASVHFLLALNSRHRQFLTRALESLANEPLQKGDFEDYDDTGRPIQSKVVGPFVISFWSDHFVKEMRIIKIERI